MTIKELREKRAKAWDDAREFLDSKRNDSGLLSEEDSQTYDAMEQQIVAYGKEIERLERQEKLAREMNAATSVPLVSAPGAHTEQTEKTGTASDSYSKAFWNNIRNRNFIDVRNDLQIGTDSEGGYLCPDEFEKKLIESLEEENIFRQLATVIQTSSGDRKIPIVTSKGEAVWMDEEEAYSLSDDVFGQASLSAYKVGTAIKISEELLNDSAFDLPSYIAKEFARRVGAKEEEAFFVGDGKGKPTGIFADAGGAEDGVTTSGAAITFDDIMELFYSLKSPYRKKAVWVMNDTTVKALRKLKDNTGNYIWNPSVQAGVPDMILNRPYYTSSYVPTLEAGSKAIAFGDFKYYWIGDRQGRTFKRLNEVFAMNGQVGFIASQRVDGRLILPEAVKTLTIKGTSTTKA
ncbi:MAG: phage major capsid protein [Ruminococcus sp.]